MEELARSERDSVAAGRMHRKTPPFKPWIRALNELSFPDIKIPEIKKKRPKLKGKKLEIEFCRRMATFALYQRQTYIIA